MRPWTQSEMSAVQAALASVQERLGESDLYVEGRSAELEELLRQEGRLKAKAGGLEERWLELQEQLEDLERA